MSQRESLPQAKGPYGQIADHIARAKDLESGGSENLDLHKFLTRIHSEIVVVSTDIVGELQPKRVRIYRDHRRSSRLKAASLARARRCPSPHARRIYRAL